MGQVNTPQATETYLSTPVAGYEFEQLNKTSFTGPWSLWTLHPTNNLVRASKCYYATPPLITNLSWSNYKKAPKNRSTIPHTQVHVYLLTNSLNTDHEKILSKSLAVPNKMGPESRRATRVEHSSPISQRSFTKRIMLLVSSRIVTRHFVWKWNHGTVNSDSDPIEDSSSRLLFWKYPCWRNGTRRRQYYELWTFHK